MDYNYRWPSYSEYSPTDKKPWTHHPYSLPHFTAGINGYIRRGIPHIFPRNRFRSRRGNFARLSNLCFRNCIPHSFPNICNPQCVMLKNDETTDELIQLPTEKNVTFNELKQEFLPVSQKTDKESLSHDHQSFINANVHHGEDNKHRYSFIPGQYESEAALTVNANNEFQNLRNFEHPRLLESGNNFYEFWSNYSIGLPVESFRTTDNSMLPLPTADSYPNQTSMESNFSYKSHHLSSEINYMPNESDSAKTLPNILENVCLTQKSENFLEQQVEPKECSVEFFSQEPMDEKSLAVHQIERLLTSMASNFSTQDHEKTKIPDFSLNPGDSSDSCAKVNALKNIQESAKPIAVEDVKLHPSIPIQVNSSEAINEDSSLSVSSPRDFVNLPSSCDKTTKDLLQSATGTVEENSHSNTNAEINIEESNSVYLNENFSNSWKSDKTILPEVADTMKYDSGLSINLVASEADIRETTLENSTDNGNNSGSASQALTPEKVQHLLEPLGLGKEPPTPVSDIMRQNQVIFNDLSNGIVTNAENMAQMEIQKTLCKNLQTVSESLTKFFAIFSPPSDSYFFHGKVNLNEEQSKVPSEEKTVLQSLRNEGSAEKAISLQVPVKKNSNDALYGDILNTNIFPNQVESTLSSVTNYVLEEPASKEPWMLGSIFNSDFTANGVTLENETELCKAEHVHDFSNEKSSFLNQSKCIFQDIRENAKYLEYKNRGGKIKFYRDVQTQTEHLDNKRQDLKLEMSCCVCQGHLQVVDGIGRSDRNNERNLRVKISTDKRKQTRCKYRPTKKRRKAPETGDFVDINQEHFSSSICVRKTERNCSLGKRHLTIADSKLVAQKDLITNHKNVTPNKFCMKNLSTFPKRNQVNVCQRKTFTVTTIRRRNVRHCALDGAQRTENRYLNQNFKSAVTQNYVKDNNNLPVEHELTKSKKENEVFFPSSSSQAGNPVLTSENMPRNNVKIILSRIDQSSVTDEIIKSKPLCQLPQKLFQVQDKNMARDKHGQKDETHMARDEHGGRIETSMARVKTPDTKSTYLKENNDICQRSSFRGPLFSYSLRQSTRLRSYSLNY
ncbi:uncharacterized protein LOC118183268 [Stegodyphus dumicola]|uniref:uncharacterized protein LOC118183268 n=1 Tax=Stegodyphus dumicola TaxID=202533 RepID=UPI0015A9ECA1|nr:uncharacterized protein LOC118183268 [Stegodyphus dumicola]